MSSIDDFGPRHRPSAIGRRLARIRPTGRNTQISISRWPRGSRRPIALAHAAGIVVVLATTTVAVLQVRQASNPGSLDLRGAMQACNADADPSCVPWRIHTRCRGHSILGWSITSRRTYRTHGRSPEEAAWIVAHVLPECVVANIARPDQAAPESTGQPR